MKRFKQIDTWVSASLIIGSVTWALLKFDHTFIIGYFVVGGWQVISMIVHCINGWFCEKGSRRFSYHWTVASIFLIAALGLIIYPVLLVLLIALIFFSPLLAIWYTWLCYQEVYIEMRRPLALLK